MYKRVIPACIFSIFLVISGWSQEKKPKNWELSGYVKQLQSTIFIEDEEDYLLDYLLHNRLNYEWRPGNAWTFSAELRTRLFLGDQIKLTDDYADLIDEGSNDFADLSLRLIDRRDYLLHSYFDRFYLEYAKDDLEIRVGRQRINWGINTVWNPNDLFNAFSFVDFDYEERPGSDAIRIRYYTGFASSIEIAVKAFDKSEEATAGILWKFNRWSYDFQFLTGIFQENFVLGSGWAGNMGQAGFKGEMSYFLPLKDDIDDAFSASIAWDYIFESGLYGTISFLYNSTGVTKGSLQDIFDFSLSAKELYPFRWAIFTSLTHPFSPLFNGLFSVVYSPVSAHPVFFNPGLTYSMAENWDLDLIGQFVFNKAESSYTSPIQAIFLRLKFSF
jgi:hypothetical protein